VRSVGRTCWSVGRLVGALVKNAHCRCRPSAAVVPVSWRRSRESASRRFSTSQTIPAPHDRLPGRSAGQMGLLKDYAPSPDLEAVEEAIIAPSIRHLPSRPHRTIESNFGLCSPPSRTPPQRITVSTAHPDKDQWFRRHTDDNAIEAAVNGHKFSDSGVHQEVHECMNLQANGCACHVGLYASDDTKARAVLKMIRCSFLATVRPKKDVAKHGARERAQQLFDALQLSDDGAPLMPSDMTFEATIVLHGSLPLGIACSSISKPVIIAGISGLAAQQTNIRCGDSILSVTNAQFVMHSPVYYLVPEPNAQVVTLKLVRRRHEIARQHFIFRIGNRVVCKDVFRHRYPLSQSTFERVCSAKTNRAPSVYALRLSPPSAGESTKGLRGLICAAWWKVYAEQNSERLPDVSIRLIPCQSIQVPC